MEDQIEPLDRLRRRILAGFVVGFSAFRVPVIVREALRGMLTVIALAGVVLFFVYMVRLFIFGGRLTHSPNLAAALLDERVRTISSRACAVGFRAVMTLLAAATVLPAVAWAFTNVGAVVTERVGAVVADMGILVGVVTTIVAFLVLDRG